MGATIVDIAKAVGVNHATVSRAFSGKVAVAPETCRRIMQAAKRMGYRPNTSARAVRTGRTGILGMIRSFVWWRSVFEPLFDFGVDEALRDRGLCLLRDVLDEPANYEKERDVPVPRIVREHMVDGLIVNYAFGTPPAVRELLDLCRIPAVWVNRKRDCNCVRPNDEGGAIEATRYLIEQGHRRIGYVPNLSYEWLSDAESHYSETERRKGYEQAMRQAGLTPVVMELRPVPNVPAPKDGHLLRACIELLGLADRPTALLCNGSGREMCHAALVVGLSVPDDLSVMTFDNDLHAGERVAVDHLLVRYRAMGRAVVNELCELIDEPGVDRPPVVLTFEFHRTGSVARPK